MKKFKVLILFAGLILHGCTTFLAHEITKPIKSSSIHSLTIGEQALSYHLIGSKDNPPLVFLHGILAFTENYSDIIEILAEQYYVIGIDIRGHGRSSIGENLFTFQNVADDVIQVTNKLGIEKFYAIGHSMGGIVLLTICKYFPENIIKGISIASLYNYEGVDFESRKKFNIKKIFFPSMNIDYLTSSGFRSNQNGREPFLIKLMDKAHHRIGEKEKFERTKKYMTEYGPTLFPSFTEEELSKIETPLLVIAAEGDTRIKPRHTKKMSNILPNSKFLEIPDAKHFGIIKSKKNLRTVVKGIFDFLQ